MTKNFDIHEWRLKQLLKEAQFDPKKSDLNHDGKLSSYEKKRGEAIAANMKEDDWMQPDDESDMAHGQLYNIKELATKLCNMIKEGDQLDAWVQAKLTKAEDYLHSVYNYMRGEEAEYKRSMDRDDDYRDDDDIEIDDVILGAQFMERKGDTDYKRAKDAKRFGVKGEKNTFGAGVAKGEKIEKEKLSRRK